MIDVSSRASRRIFYQSKAWRYLRQQALERDHFECQWCKSEGKVTTELDSVLEVDHIQELEYYPEKALELDNLRTLCKECHNKRHKRFQFKTIAKRVPQFREDEW
ncbi:HNH endonuclease [Streptococcus sp. O1]|nr:HNH endonuclease signature motif containing protein [Streptococcus sp. O1]MCQ9215026.1 HNH endonuclease [Streptococcus sp. O1]